MNTSQKLIIGASILTALGIIATGTYAHIGNKIDRIDLENAPEEIQVIVGQAKEEGRDSLTDEQKETLKTYGEQQREERFNRLPENIQSILTNIKENGHESLSEEDHQTLKTYREENPDAFPGKGGHGKKSRPVGMHPMFDLENAPEEIQVIVEQAKEEGRDSLTDEQKETLKTYGEQQREEQFNSLPENIQSILTNIKENGHESLSEEDHQTLKTYREENPDAFPGKGGHGKRGKHKENSSEE